MPFEQTPPKNSVPSRRKSSGGKKTRQGKQLSGNQFSDRGQRAFKAISSVQSKLCSEEFDSAPTLHCHFRGVRIIQVVFFVALLALPFFFGGVHERPTLITETLSFLILAISLALYRNEWSTIWSRSKPFRLFVILYGIFLGIVGIEYSVSQALTTIRPYNFPPLGFTNFLTHYRSLWWFGSVTALGVFLAFTSRHFHSRFQSIMKASAILVSLVAIGHWFRDEGLLFGYWAPNYVFHTDRARWPFVNANHLAHFLIPGFFLLFTSLFRRLSRADDLFEGESLRTLTTLPAFQITLTQITILVVGLTTISIAILGTQSRGSWAAIAAVSLIFFVFWRKVRRNLRQIRLEQKRSKKRKLQSTSGSRRKYEALRWGVRVAPLLVAALPLALLLSGSGSEKIEQRVQYGLEASKDDARWSLYSLSLPMLREAPFLGIGLGSWDETFQSIKPLKFSGISPHYLHSDPLQILVETGVLGVLPLVVLFSYLFISFLRQPAALLGLNLPVFLGLLGIGLASLVDFPFRIPAITLVFSGLLGEFLVLLSAKSTENVSEV